MTSDLLENMEDPGKPGHVKPERVLVRVVVLTQLCLASKQGNLKATSHEIFPIVAGLHTLFNISNTFYQVPL